MKKKMIFFQLFLITKFIYGQDASVLNINNKWKIYSLTIDDASFYLPSEKVYYFEIINLNKRNPKLPDERNRKVYKKLGYNGIFIYTDEKDRNSKYYCQIIAFFKVKKENVLQIIWNENFVLQDQLNKLNPDIRTGFQRILNGDAQITEGEDTLCVKAIRELDSSKHVTITINLLRFKN